MSVSEALECSWHRWCREQQFWAVWPGVAQSCDCALDPGAITQLLWLFHTSYEGIDGRKR